MIKHFESYHRITSPYGKRISPISKKEEFHTGIDIVKEHKGEIYATTDGTVVHAKFAEKGTGLGGFGNTVCVVDQNNYLHVYGHLDSVAIQNNAKVKKGDILGYQGNTGQSAGSHLHYEVRTKTTPSFGWRNNTDPLKYLDEYELKFPDIAEWKQAGLEYLQKEFGISKEWKATDTIDMGTLGTILKRIK